MFKNILCMIGAIISVAAEEVIPGIMRHKLSSMKTPSDPFLYKRLSQPKLKLIEVDPPTSKRKLIEDIPVNKRKILLSKDLPLKPSKWYKGKFYIEEHDASHLHHDMSIVVEDKVYRLARTPSTSNKKKGFMGLFPGPGEKSSWIPQPEHLPKEVPNPKLIKQGYGKGTTKVIQKGGCFVNISHSKNLHVIFDGIEGTYLFVETPNGNLMMRKIHKPINYGKHKMIDKRDVKSFIQDPNYSFFAKMDGAGVEWKIIENKSGHKHLQVFSWRPDAKLRKKYNVNTQIEHTQRLKLCDMEVNKNTPLAGGRGEIWCKGPNGLLHINSILNSLPYKARLTKYKPQLYIHDIIELNGKSVKNLSYKDKLTIMEAIYVSDKRFKIPKHAHSVQSKRALWKKCKHENGMDGIVAWKHLQEQSTPIKLKFKHDTDNWYQATIVDIKPQSGQHSNKYGYPVLENLQGNQFTSSGLGLTESIRSNMLKHPNNWIGKGVRYSAEKHFSSGNPFQPIIKEMDCE